MKNRIVFMGSPEYAVPILQTLIGEYNIVGVVTQPDRPSGRGQVLTPPPIKNLSIENNLPYIQPRRLREPQSIEQLKSWEPDIIIVAAFGQILRPEVLGLPKYGCINVHASILPRWRGASPIQAAILNGDQQTGVTIMMMDEGVDTGAILAQRAIPISEHDTHRTLSQKLSTLGAELLIETLPKYLSGQIQPSFQDPSLVTLAPMIKKEEGRLDFSKTAQFLSNQVRAFYPWPGTFTTWQGNILKIIKAHAVIDHILSSSLTEKPGEKVVYQGLPAIITLDGIFVLDEVQPAGKKPMPGKTFLQGTRNWIE